MGPTRSSSRRCLFACLSLAVVLAAPGAAQEVSDLRPEQAVDLYDRGRYLEAKPILEELDAEGVADGRLLYRLAFCRRVAGDRAGELEALERARQKLTEEVASANDLETPFYLANTFRNLGQAADAQEVAARATARFEAGKIPPPEHPMDAFRLAKLYQDQKRPDDAARWYRKALEGFATAERKYPANVAWAQRYLGDLAYSRGEFADAERAYAAMLEGREGTAAEYDRLAGTRARLGLWQPAIEAWKRAQRLDPLEADRANYCWHLAELAKGAGELPALDPEGRGWDSLSREDLETIMKDRATQAQALRAELESEDTAPDRKQAAAQELAAIKPVFVKAALEYALRRLPIRETAFFNGYAPLIFHARLWEAPGQRPDLRRRGPGSRRPAAGEKKN